MNFPIGSICTIVQSGDVQAKFVGLECTVVEGPIPLDTRCANGDLEEFQGYLIVVEGMGDTEFGVKPQSLKLKRYPGQLDSWATEKVKQLFTPNPKLVEEMVHD
jgi:hypothetical protein